MEDKQYSHNNAVQFASKGEYSIALSILKRLEQSFDVVLTQCAVHHLDKNLVEAFECFKKAKYENQYAINHILGHVQDVRSGESVPHYIENEALLAADAYIKTMPGLMWESANLVEFAQWADDNTEMLFDKSIFSNNHDLFSAVSSYA